MKKQWGKTMSELLTNIDWLRRLSDELSHVIQNTKEDPFELIRIKSQIDERLWSQEIEIQVFNDSVEAKSE